MMKPHPLLWFLPLPVGVAAYVLTSAGSSAVKAAPEISRADGARKERTDYAIVQLSDFEKGIREEEARFSKLRLDPQSAGLTAEELKEQILGLKQKLEASEDWETNQLLFRKLVDAVRRLGEEGDIHLGWMREHHPDGLPYFVDAWAGKDPHAVLNYIASSEGPAPCAKETLMTLLDRLGKEQPESFLAMVKKVPWEKFLFTSEPFGDGLRIDSEADVNRWVESGAARALLEQGVEIDGLYGLWSQQDPVASMRAWNEWGDPSSDASVGALHEILKAQIKDPEKTAALNESLSQLDEASLARMKTAWGNLEKKRTWAANEIRKSIPLLGEWSSSVTAPDP